MLLAVTILSTMITLAQQDNPEMQFPLIHLNGNDGKKLANQYFDAVLALGKFEEKFFDIEFHPRDYYPLGDEAWLKARAQWEAQKANIRSLRTFLELLSEHCFEMVER
jgi:hypothetical protein